MHGFKAKIVGDAKYLLTLGISREELRRGVTLAASVN